MIMLSKVLPIFLSPIFLCIALVCIGIGVKRNFYVLLGISVLYLSSTQIVSDYVVNFVEKDVSKMELDEISNADAIVVLSGAVQALQHGDEININWNGVSRLFAGINLFKHNKANLLVFTDGISPWNSHLLPEGQILKAESQLRGIKSEFILVSDRARNTEEEAIQVRRLLPNCKKHIILVTSAYHIPRAKMIFQNNGFIVTPFPVDFHFSSSSSNLLSFLPRPEYLLLTDTAFRELLGRLYYRIH